MSKKASLREHRTGKSKRRGYELPTVRERVRDEGKRGGKPDRENRSQVKIDLNR